MSIEQCAPIAAYFAGQNEHDVDATTDGKTVVTGRVSGTVPGSPVEIRYALTPAGDKVSRLEILS